jgi:predicted ester cyclase
MTDNNVLAVRRVFAALNTGDLASAQEYIAPDYTDPEAPNQEGYVSDGVAAFAATVDWLRNAFGDLKFEEQEVMSSGDMVVVRALMSGIQQGEFMGIPPRGKSIASRQIFIFRLTDGKVSGYKVFRDDVSMMMQLGAIHLVPDEPAGTYEPNPGVYEY